MEEARDPMNNTGFIPETESKSPNLTFIVLLRDLYIQLKNPNNGLDII